MSDYTLGLRSYSEVLQGIAERARALRLRRAIRQDELAQRAGVGVATVIRFEKSGRVSLENALRIAAVLDASEQFGRLFEAPPYASLDEALSDTDAVSRPQRAPRRR